VREKAKWVRAKGGALDNSGRLAVNGLVQDGIVVELFALDKVSESAQEKERQMEKNTSAAFKSAPYSDNNITISTLPWRAATVKPLNESIGEQMGRVAHPCGWESHRLCSLHWSLRHCQATT